MTENQAPIWTQSGDLTAVPHANDNVPQELRALGAAIGKVDLGGELVTTTFGSLDKYAPANDNLPPVVAFTGVAGSGKSTATRYLVERHGYTLVKFAGPLKDACRAMGLSERHIEGDLKEEPCDMLCGKTPRYLMQVLGTELGRNLIGDDFWIRLWRARVEQVFADAGRVVCDDCRFPNEAQAIRRLGGDIFKIEGRGGIAGEHASERGCGDQDLVIANDNTPEMLFGRVEEALRRYG
ncbi:hypothetical protein GGE68_002904 [Rhizobium leguminosarum]|uniref:deoxynucleotide monophosphate kinase family protein n=1 Tax=Rhizobium leguminosarum TaxID=384 RepID=UPI00160994AD|nr:deoxynucleotide monophosphate kinase [Rhizobium leguminosarum]MBB5664707.1 hypothetical protein [Rhizobium leguminosarum]